MMIASSNSNKRKQTVPKSKPAKSCDKCEFSTNEIVEFIEHMKLDHNLDEIYPCDLCVFYTESLWDYQGHMEKHLEQKHNSGKNISMNSSASSSTTESTTSSSESNNNQSKEEDEHLGENLIIAKSVIQQQELPEASSKININKKNHSDGEEEEGDEDEDEICQSDDGQKPLDSPKVVGANLLTTITNSGNDYKNKIEHQQSNKFASDCFDSSKMIYATKNEPSSGHTQAMTGQAFNYNQIMSNNQQQTPRDSLSNNSYIDHNGIEKAKRHYNSEVDPARYRKVLEEGVTKFACSLCGNTYKWRKSLNKHWKEKHITEAPPPLDAPVTIKLRNGNTTINCIATGGSQPQCLTQSPSLNNNSNMLEPSIKMNHHNNNNKASIIDKSKHVNKSPVNNQSVTSQLPFSPSLLVAAAAAANAATSGSGQMPSGQLHPAYWTVFHSYLNSAALKSDQSNNKFSINHLSSSSSNHTNQSPESATSSIINNQAEIPLDLSMKPNVMSRRSSINSNTSSNQSNDHHTQENHKLAKSRKSRRSDFNMQQLLQQQKDSRSSSRCSSTSSVSINSSKHSEMNQTDLASMKQDQYQSYTEDESMTMNQSSNNNQSSAAAAAAAATAYNQKLFVCSICDAKFHVVDHINEHFLNNHYNEYQRELSSKSPPRNTNVAQQNEEWNLSDPNNPLKCIKCDFVGRWPTELQKHAASHSTSRPFKCLICSLTYKWRWDLAKHFDRTHPNFRNPYKKRDRDAARSTLVGGTPSSSNNNNNSMDQDQEDNYHDHDESRSRSRSNSSHGSEHIHDYSRGIKKETVVNNIQPQKAQKLQQPQQQQRANNVVPSKLNGSAPKPEPQLPLNLNQGLNNSTFTNNSISPNQQQFANNPMMAYFAALQNNMFQQQQQQQQQTPSSSTSSTQSNNQISPFSLLQQQQKNPFLPSTQPPQFSQPETSQTNNTATILAAAMAAIAQGGVEASNMSQLLPHLLQNLQNTSSSASSTTSSTSSNNKIQENYNSNLLSPSSSSSSHSYSKKMNQPNPKRQKLSDSLLPKADDAEVHQEKETRNFLCYWCDFRGRWRSEIIQHMRCHHAREKPYRCSACMYASNWKWDVQKHTKKQHPENPTANIIEISDQILFPDLKDVNFFENVKPTLPSSTPVNHKKLPPQPNNLTPPNSSSASSASSSSSSSSLNSKPYLKSKSEMNNFNNKKITHNNQQQSTPKVENQKSNAKSLCCQQCPYVACNLSDLRRHLIVHSDEQPYHCCSCDFKSKWKSDVKKHQRSFNHTGPILVGKKAMQKVIESLGLDKSSMLTLYGPNIQVIDNKQCKSNEKLIDEDNMSYQESQSSFSKNKSNKFIKYNNQERMENGMKRKHPESDSEELFEEQNYEEEDYEQLNEDDDNMDDDYEHMFSYNQNNNYEDDLIDEDVPIEEGMVDEVDQLNEDYHEEEINSQCSDDNNCNEDLIENNLNEFEEEIDCV